MDTQQAQDQDVRMRGTVVTFKGRVGYGFIHVPGRQKQVYFHYTQLMMDGYKTVDEGDEVEFDLGEYKGKEQAQNITVVENGGGNGAS